MTRNAEGEWRSFWTTKIRRSEKLIGASYRNALSERLRSFGGALAPTLIGRMPGFEIAGYDRSFLDAFSGRRREILQSLEANGLRRTPEGGDDDRGDGRGAAPARCVAYAPPRNAGPSDSSTGRLRTRVRDI